MPVLMKKGRPGHVITVLSRPADSLRLGDLLLTLTPTIALRQRRCQRRGRMLLHQHARLAVL